jgi:Tfp pilus assembly protein PilN
VQVAKTLVTLIPATIVAEWVKGHYTGEYREHKHDLNNRADKFAINLIATCQQPLNKKNCHALFLAMPSG